MNERKIQRMDLGNIRYIIFIRRTIQSMLETTKVNKVILPSNLNPTA